DEPVNAAMKAGRRMLRSTQATADCRIPCSRQAGERVRVVHDISASDYSTADLSISGTETVRQLLEPLLQTRATCWIGGKRDENLRRRTERPIKLADNLGIEKRGRVGYQPDSFTDQARPRWR